MNKKAVIRIYSKMTALFFISTFQE